MKKKSIASLAIPIAVLVFGLGTTSAQAQAGPDRCLGYTNWVKSLRDVKTMTLTALDTQAQTYQAQVDKADPKEKARISATVAPMVKAYRDQAVTMRRSYDKSIAEAERSLDNCRRGRH